MANSTTLKLTFDTMSGSRSWSFKYANPSVMVTAIKNLGTAMITNGSILETPPVRLSAAKIVRTTETEYDIDS